ncbi:patatin-like phospholipase family protein [Noviherbaspirillum sp. UKPF54]|uniref:patatin-like phospholipase family protein n=1 Tax=Noviherbaspirillum sp. UKPF54 TaxID=2601898 RepID=UPI0011B1ABE6|nr:patatin-like phospholipase family protein [Noviherbaspirillum sp. UKPF54]QDZ27395.1 patatin-like phospholipase family protein [Noviherbaspirillum sp. UKPF54]
MSGKTITLALQGGGSHGAFTWGVLDRLLEDERIDIEGISGASAGAMNAVVLAHGLTTDGRDGARRALREFWTSVAASAPFAAIPDYLLPPQGLNTGAEPPPAYKAMLPLMRLLSPHQLNPFDINPLRDILARQIDFERLRAECPVRLFIAATQVSAGTLRLFRNRQLTLDVLLASACLPLLHRAVEIDGEAYWDGGLTANPPLFPLLHKCTARDILVVLLHPHPSTRTPVTANDIWQRQTEMGFSSTFFTELQGVLLAQREARRSWFSLGPLERRLRSLNMHVIESQELMSQLGTHSKLNAHPSFINSLHEEGRQRAQIWLDDNFEQIGVRSSFNLAQLFG